MPNSNDTISQLIQRLSSLQIEQQEILKQLKQQLGAANNKINVGNWVRITNHISRIGNKIATEKDQQGIVTKVTKSRVSLTTDNGTRTWRIASNLERIGKNDK